MVGADGAPFARLTLGRVAVRCACFRSTYACNRSAHALHVLVELRCGQGPVAILPLQWRQPGDELELCLGRTRAPVRVHRWQTSRHSCCCRSWLSLGGLVAGKRRARRDSRDAARRSRPSSSSSSASVAMIATTARPLHRLARRSGARCSHARCLHPQQRRLPPRTSHRGS